MHLIFNHNIGRAYIKLYQTLFRNKQQYTETTWTKTMKKKEKKGKKQ